MENIVRKEEIACYNVFHSYLSLVCQNVAFCGNGLIPFHTKRTNLSIFHGLSKGLLQIP